MKISYIYHFDASRPSVQSGRPASILDALNRAQCEVHRIFPLRDEYRVRRIMQKVFWHSLGRRYLVDRHPALLRSYARQVEKALAREAGDVLFSPGTLAISHLETDIPITFCSDASLAILLDFYPSYSRLSPFLRRTAERSEELALAQATLAIYPSDWAARSAIEHYGLPASRVAVLPFGANLGAANTESEVHDWIAARDFKTIRLLFVGREWERKGGDLVVQTARCLIESGMRVEVDLVGPKRPPDTSYQPFVRHHGSLDPGNAEQRSRLAALFRSAHLLFVPSRAEAFGLVFAEASAFGVPSISTAVGGIPGAIRQGINGHLLSPEAGPEDYHAVIEKAVGDPNHYNSLARRSFQEFQTRLNWDVFCKNYLTLVRDRILGDREIASTGVADRSPCAL
jgi:glycosyltransferase involved in cell wall biosynthesis